MNIQYAMHPVIVRSYTKYTDEYGQPRQRVVNERLIDMAIYKQNYTNIETPQFIDANAVGLTQDRNISTNDQIIDKDFTYNVMYIKKAGRFIRVQLSKS